MYDGILYRFGITDEELHPYPYYPYHPTVKPYLASLERLHISFVDCYIADIHTIKFPRV